MTRAPARAALIVLIGIGFVAAPATADDGLLPHSCAPEDGAEAPFAARALEIATWAADQSAAATIAIQAGGDRAELEREGAQFGALCEAALQLSPHYPHAPGAPLDRLLAASLTLTARAAEQAGAAQARAVRKALNPDTVADALKAEQRAADYEMRGQTQFATSQRERAQKKRAEAGITAGPVTDDLAQLALQTGAANTFACHAIETEQRLRTGVRPPPAGTPLLKPDYCTQRRTETERILAAVWRAATGPHPMAEAMLYGALGRMILEEAPVRSESEARRRDRMVRNWNRYVRTVLPIMAMQTVLEAARGQGGGTGGPIGSVPPPGFGAGFAAERQAGIATPRYGADDVAPRDAGPSGEGVCGPDVSDKVTGVMRRMVEDAAGWSADERRRRCTALVNPFAADAADGYAWDIVELSSQAAPPVAPRPRAEQSYWLESAGAACAVPRRPCGPSVQLFGRCVHARVVNTVQWGVLSELCAEDGAAPRHVAAFMYTLRDRARPFIELVAGLGEAVATGTGAEPAARDALAGFLGAAERATEDELAMTRWDETPWRGSRYDEQAAMAQVGAALYLGITGDAEREELDAAVALILDDLHGDPRRSDWSRRPERACATACRLTSEEQSQWDKTEFRYRWLGSDGRAASTLDRLRSSGAR